MCICTKSYYTTPIPFQILSWHPPPPPKVEIIFLLFFYWRWRPWLVLASFRIRLQSFPFPSQVSLVNLPIPKTSSKYLFLSLLIIPLLTGFPTNIFFIAHESSQWRIYVFNTPGQDKIMPYVMAVKFEKKNYRLFFNFQGNFHMRYIIS